MEKVPLAQTIRGLLMEFGGDIDLGKIIQCYSPYTDETDEHILNSILDSVVQ